LLRQLSLTQRKTLVDIYALIIFASATRLDVPKEAEIVFD